MSTPPGPKLAGLQAEATANPTLVSQLGSGPTGPPNLRKQRIQDLLTASLGEPDPFAANMGVMTSDLLFFADELRESLVRRMSAVLGSGDRSSAYRAEMDLHLRYAREIARFAHLQKQRPQATPSSRNNGAS